MAFLVATFVVFLVSERAIKAKQSQFIAGVGATNFWLSTFLWDALCFIIPSALVIVVVVAFQTKGYSVNEVLGFVLSCRGQLFAFENAVHDKLSTRRSFSVVGSG